mmetsp:Transcript_1483/g.3998  ORF Transcript_1483/g.3998 Transcript_1483/m.3998 type:complete len:131 (+) Transcript_1483:78-470(+)
MRVCVYRDVEAEAVRASIRIRDVEITAMPKQTAHLTGQDRPVPLTVGTVVWVAGLVKRPEYSGFEGKITAVLPPNTPGNTTGETRYRVSVYVVGIELSLRAENLRPSLDANDKMYDWGMQFAMMAEAFNQ